MIRVHIHRDGKLATREATTITCKRRGPAAHFEVFIDRDSKPTMTIGGIKSAVRFQTLVSQLLCTDALEMVGLVGNGWFVLESQDDIYILHRSSDAPDAEPPRGLWSKIRDLAFGDAKAA